MEKGRCGVTTWICRKHFAGEDLGKCMTSWVAMRSSRGDRDSILQQFREFLFDSYFTLDLFELCRLQTLTLLRFIL